MSGVAASAGLVEVIVDVGGTDAAAIVEAGDTATLREMADWFRDKMQGGVIVLGSVSDRKPLRMAGNPTRINSVNTPMKAAQRCELSPPIPL